MINKTIKEVFQKNKLFIDNVQVDVLQTCNKYDENYTEFFKWT